MTDTSSTADINNPTTEQKARAFDAFVGVFDHKAEFVSRRREPMPVPTEDYMPGTGAAVPEITMRVVDTYQWIVRAPTSNLREAILRLLPEFRGKS